MPSPLAGLVTLELYPCRRGEQRRPPDRQPLATDGSCVLPYAPQLDGSSWLAPSIFMELQSHADRDLFVAVLDLTDRFRCHPAVRRCKLGAGRPLALNDGAPLPATLPAGVPVEPGRFVRDWLKLIVSDVDFDASSFTMEQLDDPPPAASRGVPRSTLDRLAAKAISRDIGDPVTAGSVDAGRPVDGIDARPGGRVRG